MGSCNVLVLNVSWSLLFDVVIYEKIIMLYKTEVLRYTLFFDCTKRLIGNIEYIFELF